MSRRFEVHLEESLTVDDGLGLKQKRPGQKRPVAEEVNRPETFRKTGARHRVERLIDRSDPNPDNWHYREKITDLSTGEVVRQVDEPLKDHTGRGSAKGQKVDAPKIVPGPGDAPPGS
jgi:hypothetical protein